MDVRSANSGPGDSDRNVPARERLSGDDVHAHVPRAMKADSQHGTCRRQAAIPLRRFGAPKPTAVTPHERQAPLAEVRDEVYDGCKGWRLTSLRWSNQDVDIRIRRQRPYVREPAHLAEERA